MCATSVAQRGPAGLELAHLLRCRAVRRTAEPFQLSTGAWSRDFVDLRGTLSAGAALAVAARAVIETLRCAGVAFDAVGGFTMGADPIAHAVALFGGSSWFSIRKQEKRPGSGRVFDGARIDASSRVVVVDDTVSSGRSVVRAVEILRANGGEVVAACPLLDRSDRLVCMLGRMSVRYLPVLTYADLGLEPV